MQIPLGPAKRAVPCPLCNEQFFPASLPFHQKQCEKRRGARVVPCPYCNKEVTQLALPEHIKSCPKGGGRGKRSSDRSPAPSQRSSAAERPDRERYEATLPHEAQFEAQVLDDGRMGCVYCGRFFNPERIHKHQEICSKLKSARPKGVDGQPTQTAAKVFDSQAARTGKGSAFVSAEKYKVKQERLEQAAEAEKRERTLKSGTWKRQSQEFQEACRAGRGEAPPPQAARSKGVPPGMIQCPHCARNFSEHVADRHIPICAKVINRPKPPPSPSLASRTIKPPDSSSTSPPGGARARRESPARSVRGESPSRSTPRATGADRQARSSSVPQRLPSMPKSPATSGAAMQAVRDLRRQASTDKLARQSSDKLPQLTSPDRTARGSTLNSSISSAAHTSPNFRKPPAAPRKSSSAGNTTQLHIDEEATLKLEDGASCYGADCTDPDRWPEPVAEHAVVRVGLRRSAMMYRLLSQVPKESLERELQDCGVDPDALDQEGMIEAIIEQLA